MSEDLGSKVYVFLLSPMQTHDDECFEACHAFDDFEEDGVL